MPDHPGTAGPRGTLTLWMEIELDADPIRGAFAAPKLARREFSGWLGLAAALEALRSGSERREP